MQISATLVKGKARVQFGANKVRSPDPGLVGLAGAVYTSGHEEATVGLSCSISQWA